MLDIEDALRWAYRDELPKCGLAGASGVPSSLGAMSELGTHVDNSTWNDEPGYPAAVGEPHADAEAIAAAVIRLARFRGHTLDEPGLMPDLGFPGIDERATLRHRMGHMASLAMVHAKLGNRPDAALGPLSLERLSSANGAPLVLRPGPGFIRQDGRQVAVETEMLVPCKATRGGERPVYPEGARSPLKWLPDPAELVRERAIYLTWWLALDALATDLAGKLETITVLAPSAPARPWAGDRELGKPPQLFAAQRAPLHMQQNREEAAAARARGERRALPRGAPPGKPPPRPAPDVRKKG